MSNSIVVQPDNVVSNLGLITEFHCEGSAGASYQWQIRNYNEQFTDIINPTSTTDTLHYVPDKYEVYFRCVLTFPDSEILYTNEVEITPGEPPNVGMFNGWYYSERYHGMTSTQRWHNITKLMNIMVHQWQWTKEAASGICGNIWAESMFSPGDWQEWPLHGKEDTTRGYGLVQWTPAKDTLIPYAKQYFPDVQWRNNADIQLSRFYYEYTNNFEWISYGGWNTVHSTESPGRIAELFVRGYLRPGAAEIERTLGNRMFYAFQIYEQYQDIFLIPILKKITLQGRRNK